MANPEHVKIVKAGPEAIQKARTDDPRLRLNLNDAELSGADLTGANLSGANLSGANLSGADLNRANLSRADLTKTNLGRVNLYRAELAFAILIEADLTKANLQTANLYGAHLTSANLGAADFYQANLQTAQLQEANLRGAILQDANLRKADLQNADVQEANLHRADLFSASLREANLREAHLTGTGLHGADLMGADLTQSYWGGTSIGNTCLDGVATLAETVHSGPSSLGLDTIVRNAANLPDAFLRGCGVPEEWIDYIPSLTGSAFQFYSCFISYNHDDKQFARQLHDRLQGQGIRCWLDEHAMVPGDDIYRKVDEGIRIWDKVLLCCSEASLQSPWVEREIDTAIEKEMDFQKSKGEKILKIIPLNLDGSLFDWTGSHAATLRKRLAADFTGWKSDADKFEQQFENVVKALRTDRGQLPPPKPKLGS